MSGTVGFPVPSQQPQPKVLVVWSEGKTSTVRAEDEDDEGAHSDAAWKPLPFQYQIPVNKYSTLHNIAVKRSAVRRGQKDIDNHRTTIAIPKYETVFHHHHRQSSNEITDKTLLIKCEISECLSIRLKQGSVRSVKLATT